VREITSISESNQVPCGGAIVQPSDEKFTENRSFLKGVERSAVVSNAMGKRRGLTLVEVLVVIAIISLLLGLLLPAVEMAREASRRSSCANQLRQLAIGVKLHVDAHQTFPTGGWRGYLGDPDAGYGVKQPGGWIYNVLAYIDQSELRKLGGGLKLASREDAMRKLMESPIQLLYCPSRRLPRIYPYSGPSLKNAKAPIAVAKTDYAINSVLSFEKSEVIVSDIQLRGKGISRTLLLGEKALSQNSYTTGAGSGDGLVAYVGEAEDIRRDPRTGIASDESGGAGFGSAHIQGANVANCDASVRYVLYDEGIEL
jgi:prepilin-type N-terminal cleavage/methylation domain-containing protein